MKVKNEIREDEAVRPLARVMARELSAQEIAEVNGSWGGLTRCGASLDSGDEDRYH